jgi:hypothetical protein
VSTADVGREVVDDRLLHLPAAPAGLVEKRPSLPTVLKFFGPGAWSSGPLPAAGATSESGCSALGTVAAASLLPSEPALAAVLAVLALVSLHRVRRERRSVAALHRLAATARSGRPTTEGSA